MGRRFLSFLICAAILPACADGDPRPDVVVVVENSDGHDELWVLTEAGGRTLLLPAEAGASLYDPRWSADRLHVSVHVSRADGVGLHVLPIDGTPGVEIVRGQLDVRSEWTPRGTRLAYYSHVDVEPLEIRTVEPDGSEPRLLGTGYWFVWSPAGDRLAYRSEDGLQIAAADGSWSVTVHDGETAWFEWCRDGSRLGYARWESGWEITLFSCLAVGAPSIALSASDVFVQDPWGLQKLPAWSPDGSRLSYCSGPGGSTLNVVRSDVADSVAVLLPMGAIPARGAVWSSDSRYFAVVAQGQGPQIVEADGTLLWNSGLASTSESIAWRPGGLCLAATSEEGAMLLEVDRRRIRFLAPAAGGPIQSPFPLWSRTGTPSPS